MSIQHLLVETEQIIYCTLLKGNSCNGFNEKDFFFNEVESLVDSESLDFLNHESFKEYMEHDVVLGATGSDFSTGHYFEGLLFLKLDELKEPYPGFCHEFGLKMDQFNKVLNVSAREHSVATQLLLRGEQNIKYANKEHVFSIVNAHNFAEQQIFIDAGYLLRKFSSNRMVAYKNINKSADINIYLDDSRFAEGFCYISAMKEYRPTAANEFEIRVQTNSNEIFDVMDRGFMIAGLERGEYICKQFYDVCYAEYKPVTENQSMEPKLHVA